MNRNPIPRIILPILLVLTVILEGCSSQLYETKNAATTLETKQHTHSIVDHMGRKVEVPEQPQRVLALTRNFMEEILILGIIPVGKVDEYNNRPEGISLPSVSKQATPNVEAILSLHPDVIVANIRQHAQMLENLQSSGAAVIFIDPNQTGADPLAGRIQFLGEILNRQEAAQNYIARLNNVSVELKQKVAEKNYKSGLILDGSGDMTKAAQPSGFYGAMLQRLGIRNIVPAGLPGSNLSTWVTFDRETILKESPDFILIKAVTNNKNSQNDLLERFYDNPAWQDLKAVKERKVFVLPATVDPGKMDNITALQMTARILCEQEL